MNLRRRHRRGLPATTLVGVAVSIILLCILSSRYSTQEKTRVLVSLNYTWTDNANPYSLPPPEASRFLAYIPHSGFHNQRIELENAIVLSILLNRTLVLPLARLGANPLPYKPFDELLKNHAHSDKSWLSHCRGADTAANSTVKECRKFERYTHISWQDVIDITRVEELGAQIVERWNFGTTWFGDTLQVHANETYWLKDASPYELQFYDGPRNSGLLSKYERKLSLQELGDLTQHHALLHLGTLFGTSRLRLTNSLNKALRTRVRSAMTLSNPFLDHLTDRIVSHIGGQDTFFSVHLRLGDGLFAEGAVVNSHGVWSRLLKEMYGMSNESRTLSSLSLQTVQPHTYPSTLRRVPLQNVSYASSSCSENLNVPTSLSTPLFIATDALSPRAHPALHPFIATFPCIFFLAEFHSIAQTLQEQVNPLDESPMAKFLLPFVDALVASRAASVIGTPESTFSRYVEDILWPVEHGLEVLV